MECVVGAQARCHTQTIATIREPFPRKFPVVTVYPPAITVLSLMNESDGVIGIETFSITTRWTMRALRLYDKKGLLTPARRGITGYRQYSYQQIRRGIQLKRLSDLGFGIREMLEITDGKPASENALQPQSLYPDRQMTESRMLSG